MPIPGMCRFKQTLEGPAIADVPREVRSRLGALGLAGRIKVGQTVAITAGSRGITGIAGILRAVVEECASVGLRPFIVPAMGSHAGATAEGQQHLLEHYGITATTMGCEIRSSMDVVPIGEVRGIPVFCDRLAWEADHIGVVARVKPHTDFDNEIESGFFKMMSVGLGKRQGAEHYHRAGHDYTYADVFPSVGKKVLETARILFGLGVVENGNGQTARIEAVLPSDFYETEKALLILAKAWLGRLPFEALDLLIVDEMGKNISGTGMDPNVIGRPCIQKHTGRPKIRQLLVRDLTPESDGNALGVGMADLTTKRLVDKINRTTTNINVITTGALDLAKVPMFFASDREAVEVALGMIGLTASRDAWIVRIKNTLHLTEMDVSEPLLGEAMRNPRLSRVGGSAPMRFDLDGNLAPF
jgi:hypothetical protein